MKKLLSLLMIVMVALNLNAADYRQAPPVATGMPGDNLNLYVVLDMFKDASSVENFEYMLNNSNYNVNNLDLNNDGYIDYLKVTDYGNGNYHTIVIQDMISGYEVQDVAIIDLQKDNGNNVVHVQIIGDENLYGKNYIIEPYIAGQVNTVQYVNAWAWPCVSVIFKVGYNPWASPWHWASYPTWWNNRPIKTYNVYYNNFNNFGWDNYSRRNTYINQTYYNNYYNNKREVSKTVNTNINNNAYKNNGNPNVKSNNGNHYGNNNPNSNNGNYQKNKQGNDSNKSGNSNNNNENKGNWNKQNQQGNNSNNGNDENKGNWNKQNSGNSNSNQQPKVNSNQNSNTQNSNQNSNQGYKGNNKSNNGNQQNSGTKQNNSNKQQMGNNGNSNKGNKGK